MYVIINACSCAGIMPVPIASFPLSNVGKGLKLNLHLVYVHMCTNGYRGKNRGAGKLLGSRAVMIK